MMRAAVLTEIPTTHLQVRRDCPDPALGLGAALLEIEACGICGTDLEILAGRSYAPDLPHILGHEPVGRVVAVGNGVDPTWQGRRVTLTIFVGQAERCSICTEHSGWPTPCRNGDERLCHGGAEVIGVLGRPGGFAERLVVPARLLVEVPDALDSLRAASLVDAGATAANASRLVPSEDPRARVIFGAGPVGFTAAQLVGGDVVVVDPQANRRAAVMALGYTAVATIDEVGGPVGVIVDCAGARGLLERGLDVLGARGIYIVAGYGPAAIDTAALARKELTVRGVRSGRAEDLRRVLAAAALGELQTPAISTWPLEEINGAFAALRHGAVAGKVVITLHHKLETR